MPGKIFESEYLRKYLKHPFIIYRSNEFDEQIFSYDEMLKTIELLHEQFKALKLSSSCFAIDLMVLPVSFETISLLIGILNYGGHFYPVPRDIADTKISKNLLRDCAANYLFCNDLSAAESLSTEFLAEITVSKEKFLLYEINNQRLHAKAIAMPENMCYTISTTGTTGSPKMVHVPYDCIAPNVESLCCKFKLTNEDVIYLGTPFTFDPFIVELFMALASGAALLLTPLKYRLNPNSLLQMLWPENPENTERLAVTVVQMTPSIFRKFGLDNIKQKIFAFDSKLRILFLGGEKFPAHNELLSWLPEKSKTNLRIFNIYGITELSCWSSIYEWNPNVEYKRAPIGLPLDDSTLFRIVTIDNAEEIGYFGKGELFVGSATRKTYIPTIDDIENVNNKSNVLYRSTGDLVERDSTGNIVYIGRINDIFKRMGKRICLSSIEQSLETKLATFGNIQIVFLWHEEKQNLFCCIKVDSENQISNIKNIILKHLAGHEKPDRTFAIKTLPLDNHNKLNRRKLLEDVLKYSNPIRPLDKFKHFLKEVLNFDESNEFASASTYKRLKLDTNGTLMAKSFSALGGSSFQALSLATEIGEKLANPDDQRTLLKMLLDASSSISEICDFLRNVTVNDNIAIETENSNISLHEQERQLKMLWRVYMEKCVDAAPTLNDDHRTLCIGSHAGLLFNIDTATGGVLTQFKLSERIECPVTFVSDEFALVGCNAGYLHGLSLSVARLEWSLYIGNKVKAKPLVIDLNFAIVGCYNAEYNLAGVDFQKAEIVWRKKVGSRPIFAAPISLSPCTALICTLDGTYECIDVKRNQTVWTQKCDSPIFSTPKSICDGRKFLLAEVDGKLHLCQSETGQILQSFQSSGNIFSNIEIFQCKDSVLYIFFGCHDHHVYCLKLVENDSTETQLIQNWATKLNAAVFGTPSVVETSSESYVVACSTKGLLVILKHSNGAIVSKHCLNNEVFSSTCCLTTNQHEIEIYFGCRDNYVYCFRY